MFEKRFVCLDQRGFGLNRLRRRTAIDPAPNAVAVGHSPERPGSRRDLVRGHKREADDSCTAESLQASADLAAGSGRPAYDVGLEFKKQPA